MGKISKFGLRLLVPLSPQEAYSLIVGEALKLIKAEYGSIAIREGNKFNKVYTTSPVPYNSQVRQKAYTYQAYNQREILVVPASRTAKAHPELKKLGIKYTIHIPLSYKNESIGVLIINSTKGYKFNKQELVTLKLFGSMASLAIKKTQLNEETKIALELRDHFISMAAHELRTPLTSVIGYVQLLYSKLANTNTPESRWTEQLYKETERLKNLVDELLEINRIKTGQLNYYLKICSLREILGRVKKVVEFSFPEKKFLIVDHLKNLPDKIIADNDKIMQAFINLLENGVKYSSKSSPIKIVLDFKDPDFIIKIKDKGIGIPKKEFKKIFESYQQGSGHNKEGIGIGLFLVKNILESLSGSIKVHSSLGQGTTMEVRLPKANI